MPLSSLSSVEEIHALKVSFTPVTILEKDQNYLYQGEYKLDELILNNITVEPILNTNSVNINISFDLQNVEFFHDNYSDYQKQLDDWDSSNTLENKALLKFTDIKYYPGNPETQEIDTKQMISLVVIPIDKEYEKDNAVPPSLVLRPTVEDNDANVNVNFSCLLEAKTINDVKEAESPGLLVDIAPPRLGEYIIDGLLDADSFHFTVDKKTATVNLSFILSNAIIYDNKQLSLPKELRKTIKTTKDDIKKHINGSTKGYLKLKPINDGHTTATYEIETKQKVTDGIVKTNFSFLLVDSIIIGGTDKVLGESGKILGGSGKILGGSGKILGGSGKILGGSGKILGGSGKILGGSSDTFTSG
jgi:hypothetical protein